MKARAAFAVTVASAALFVAPGARADVDFAGDARALDALIVANYAYEDHWPGGLLPDSPVLARERDAVRDRDSLLHYAEDRIASLADHHAITGSSFKDSWAIVPTYSDLWIEQQGEAYLVTAVRAASPSAVAGIVAGDRLTAVGGVPVAKAVVQYWAALGLPVTGDRGEVGARVLAAGRRDRPRDLSIAHAGTERRLTLPSLYTIERNLPPVTIITQERGIHGIRINNSLGDQTSIAAFDAAMAAVPDRAALLIDLTDTPSGGNTSVARAMMSWFVNGPVAYQVHSLPLEERETGIARQWIEQVLPRAGKFHSGPVSVRVGRWTGSMGEGIAIGFRAIGATVCGGAMAQLRGAVYDFALPSSGLVVKFATERLTTTDGIAREKFVPPPCSER